MKKSIAFRTLTSLLLMFAVIISSAAMPGVSANAATKVKKAAGPQVIMTTPTDSTSDSVNITWYDLRKKDRLVYTTADDTSFAKAKVVKSGGRVTGAEPFYEFDKAHASEFKAFAGKKLYHHAVTLDRLTPDTEYIYKVVSGKKESTVRSFKTAGDDTSFCFAWFADLHADPKEEVKLKYFNKLMDNVEMKAGDKVDLVLFSGDLVKYGNLYTAWTQWDKAEAAKNHILVPTPGNKEYYRCTSYAGDSKTKYYSGEWFENTLKMPDNGPEGIEGAYYFIYNNVLFVSLNSCQEADERNKVPYDSEAVLEAQKQWLKNIVLKEKGNYAYIVVQEHYSFFYHDYDEDVDVACDWYDNWRETFDECGVDIALSADVHAYCRSKRLFDDKESNEKNKGTVYLTYAELMDYRMDDIMKPGLDPRVAAYYRESTNNAGLFVVTPEKITFDFVDYKGRVVDKVSVPRKNRE